MLFCSLGTILEFGTRKVQDFFATQKCTLRRSTLEKGLGFPASSKQAGMMLTMMMMVLRIVTASSKLRRKDQESSKDKDSEESQQSSRIFRTVRT
jgi:hypothetical protein